MKTKKKRKCQFWRWWVIEVLQMVSERNFTICHKKHQMLAKENARKWITHSVLGWVKSVTGLRVQCTTCCWRVPIMISFSMLQLLKQIFLCTWVKHWCLIWFWIFVQIEQLQCVYSLIVHRFVGVVVVVCKETFHLTIELFEIEQPLISTPWKIVHWKTSWIECHFIACIWFRQSTFSLER